MSLTTFETLHVTGHSGEHHDEEENDAHGDDHEIEIGRGCQVV